MSDNDHTAEAAINELAHVVTPVKLLPALEHLLSTRDANGKPKKQAGTFIWGAMGIGKTDIVRAMGKFWGLRIVALHLPQFDPTDLKGIPVRYPDGRVVWVPSSYLPTQKVVNVDDEFTKGGIIPFNMPCAEDVMVHILDEDNMVIARYNDAMHGELDGGLGLTITNDMFDSTVTINGKLKKGYKVVIIDKAIIFLDELSAAVPEVQNAALSLVLDKRVGEYDVPPTIPICAAGNRESDAAYVHQLSAPLANRFIHLRLMHSYNDWQQWAIINRVHPHVIGYLQFKQDQLFMFTQQTEANMAKGDCGFPTPRSWTHLSDQLTDTLSDDIMNSIICGAVGIGVGNSFIAHRMVCDQLPNPIEILKGKKIDFDEDLDAAVRYSIATSLCYALEDFHKKYYDEAFDGQIKKQPQEWQVAADSFCNFIDNHLGRDLTVMCVHLVAKQLGISFTRLKDIDDEDFDEFSEKYREILRKTI